MSIQFGQTVIDEIKEWALAALREVKEARGWSIGREPVLYCDGAIEAINEILRRIDAVKGVGK